MRKVVVIILALCMMLSLPACQKQCEHTYSNEVTQEPSCNAAGTRTYTCSLCGDTYAEAIPETEHEFGEVVVTKKASCIEEGEKSHTCENCGFCEVVEKTAFAKHKYSTKVTVVATCTQSGQKTFTCSVCKDSYTEIIAKARHNYSAKITTAATCTTAGVKTYTCSGCEDSYTETIAKTSHSYTSKVTAVATCTSTGVKTYTCSGCKDSYTETIPAKGHQWSNATCTKAKECSSCGITSGEPLGHTTNNGTCSRCGQTFSVADKCNLTVKDKLPRYMFVYLYDHIDAPFIYMSITGVEYTFTANTDGTVDLSLNFDVKIIRAEYKTASFYISIYDSEGKMVAHEKVYVKGSAAEGLYTTASETIRDLEPGEYSIKLSEE